MAAEAGIAEELGLLSRADRERLISLLALLRLPHVFPRLGAVRAYRDAMARDKKSDADGVKFVLMRGIGKCAIGVSVPDEVVQKIAVRDTIYRKGRG
jgi:3-dehydroquinate synthetase